MNQFARGIENIVLGRRLLQKGEAVLVAVSGGLDSMVLLHTLHSLSAAQRWKLNVVHCNHQLRGAESDADERFVARAATKLGLPFHSARVDVKQTAQSTGVSLEMAARTVRHDCLARIARELGLRKIALAHHADDQVELFFLRLLRGAGTQGLGGMKWRSPSPANRAITLLRPLLDQTRTALAEYARAQKISFREDSSNRSNDIQRNRIRNQLLPLLRRDYHPKIDQAVLRSMRLAQDEGDFVTLEAVQWLQSRRPVRSFDALHVALQRRVVQLELIAAGVVPQFEHVELLRNQDGEWIAVRDNLSCRRTATGKIETRTGLETPILDQELRLRLTTEPGSAAFGPLNIQWSLASGNKLPRRHVPQSERFDARAVGTTVILRRWQNGDRFQPIGLPRPTKLQDLFVNRKIPRERRHQLAVATTADGEIFWVEGLRIGDQFKVTSATRHMLVWKWSEGADTR